MSRSVAATLVTVLMLIGGSPATADDIWGPGNAVSDVHGPADLQAPKTALPSAHAPDTPNWRKLCKDHFRAPLRTTLKKQMDLRAALGDGIIDPAECRRQWSDYAATTEECVKTYPEYAGQGGPLANPADADTVCR